MTISKEMRLLLKKWETGQSWPKRLDAIEISGIRGWAGQRIDFQFPIVAIVGENGAGKSTILQAAASVYKNGKQSKFASTFFPDTPWEKVEKAYIKWWVREGSSTKEGSVRKESTRWRGNPDRRDRPVVNIDLSRIQPVSSRVGYSRLAKPNHKIFSELSFDEERLKRLSAILGKQYSIAAMSLTDFDKHRAVPKIAHNGKSYSGFHGGAGEITTVELLNSELPKYSLVVIDEIESSLHPRAQRRLIRDLAEIARLHEIQFIISTHSPYILDELPDQARMYVWEGASGREIMKGVSPSFAMTKMDLEHHPECDIYVEDRSAETMIREIIISADKDLLPRCLIIPYGAASVGQSLGQMASGKRFPRPSVVYLDGDQDSSPGCQILPGYDAPERVVFEALKAQQWQNLHARIGRGYSTVADACNRAMTADDHHDWVRLAADELLVAGDVLWQAMCSLWVPHLTPEQTAKVLDPIRACLP